MEWKKYYAKGGVRELDVLRSSYEKAMAFDEIDISSNEDLGVYGHCGWLTDSSI